MRFVTTWNGGAVQQKAAAVGMVRLEERRTNGWWMMSDDLDLKDAFIACFSTSFAVAIKNKFTHPIGLWLSSTHSTPPQQRTIFTNVQFLSLEIYCVLSFRIGKSFRFSLSVISHLNCQVLPFMCDRRRGNDWVITSRTYIMQDLFYFIPFLCFCLCKDMAKENAEKKKWKKKRMSATNPCCCRRFSIFAWIRASRLSFFYFGLNQYYRHRFLRQISPCLQLVFCFKPS